MRARTALLHVVIPLAIIGAVATPTVGAAVATARFHTARLLPVMPFGVHGSVAIADDTAAGTVTVRLDMSGLAPGTRHVMHIHRGLMCAAMVSGAMPMATMGKILVPLGVHTADAHGRIRTTITVRTSVRLDFGAIHLMVHHGPTITNESSVRPVACADIH